LGATLEQLELIATLCSNTKFKDERELTPTQAAKLEQVEQLRSLEATQSARQLQTRFPTRYNHFCSPGSYDRKNILATLTAGGLSLDDSKRTVVGDASEKALFNFVRHRHSIELLRFHHPRVHNIPFNSRTKFAISITRTVGLANESANKRSLLMKGAPEVVLVRCSHFMHHGELLPMTERFKKEFQAACESFALRGQRVLGFAMRDLPEDEFGTKFDSLYASQPEAIPSEGLVFVGLVSLYDPPKENVLQAVKDCHSAGIKVIMVRAKLHVYRPMNGLRLSLAVYLMLSSVRFFN
jgi:magnesium-transporting ATPase (P-type)